MTKLLTDEELEKHSKKELISYIKTLHDFLDIIMAEQELNIKKSEHNFKLYVNTKNINLELLGEIESYKDAENIYKSQIDSLKKTIEILYKDLEESEKFIDTLKEGPK